MFGLIYSMIVSAGAISHKMNENIENKRNKIKYKSPDGLTYLDTNGRSRLISNDELVFYTHDKNGDYILEDVSGHVYKNFSKEQREKEFHERINLASKNNETTYCIDDNDHSKDWVCKGKRFKDFNTGNVYVIRQIKYKYYYMDISNGFIVRKTDWQIERDEKMKDAKILNNDLNIEEFNEKQKAVTNRNMLYRDFEYNRDCDRRK